MLGALVAQTVFQSCSQDGHLGIVAQGIVGRDTPDDLDVRVQLVEEFVYLLHLAHEDGLFLARVYIK